VQESLDHFFRDVALGPAVLERNGEFVLGQERSRFGPPMLFITSPPLVTGRTRLSRRKKSLRKCTPSNSASTLSLL